MSNLTSGQNLEVLIASRICHDLISPIGAIGNGVELMQATQHHGQSPELALVAQSAEIAAAKLEFFRLAFGQAGGDVENVCPKISRILKDQFNKPRLTVDLNLPVEPVLRRNAKLLALMALCVERALPKGGTLHLSLSQQTILAEASGPVVRADSRAWDLLRDIEGAGELTAADVQFSLLRQYTRDLGRTLSLTATDARLSLTTRPLTVVKVA